MHMLLYTNYEGLSLTITNSVHCQSDDWVPSVTTLYCDTNLTVSTSCDFGFTGDSPALDICNKAERPPCRQGAVCSNTLINLDNIMKTLSTVTPNCLIWTKGNYFRNNAWRHPRFFQYNTPTLKFGASLVAAVKHMVK